MKHTFLLTLCLLLGITAGAQTADVKVYYSAANKTKGAELKTALHKIIKKHKERKYDDLWKDFHATDKRSDGKVWDMYSSVTSYTFGKPAQGANAHGEGDGYNREHSFPKSWFNNGYPMYTDLFHLYPVDVHLNTRRSNNPYGETKGERFTSKEGWSKLGACTTPGYSGTVFEPNDEYKGDLARTYFYMVTAYEDRISGWRKTEGVKATLNGTTYPAFTEWQLKMLLRWAKADPVSEKEIARNNAVYGIQENRNPFIDFPGLEVYVWGDSVNRMIDLLAYKNPYTGQKDTTGIDSTLIIPKDTITTPKDSTGSGTIPDGAFTYVKLTDLSQLKHGSTCILVAVTKNVAMAVSSKKGSMGYVSVEVLNDKINFSTLPEGLLPLRVNKTGVYYTFQTPTNTYLSCLENKNVLHTSEAATEPSAQWTIELEEDGAANISNASIPSRHIRYNASSPRFSTYTSKQTPVTIFVAKEIATGVNSVLRPTDTNATRYDLSGRPAHRQRGLLIRNGKKVWQ